MYRLASRVASSVASSTRKNNNLVYNGILSSRNYVTKDINFGIGARAAILQGVSEVAEAVKVTMGPKGRNVIIEKGHGRIRITKDGVTVAKSIKFKDKTKNVGADLVKQVAKATNTAAGDGTTCATVLTQAILTEGCKSIAAGVNVMDLRNGINRAVDAVITDLKSRALMISTPEEITQVGTISANGERDIGELIARAMEKVGKEGVITVADGNTLDNELEVVEGMKLTRGYISPYFITDQKTQKCELENPFILIHDKKISDMNSLLKILELAKKRPLLVVAEDVESDALAMLILNKHHGGLKVCAIKAPGFGDSRRANLDDLAILTGGEVITEDRGLTLDKVQTEMLGTAKKVSISIDDTIILHGGGDKKLIEERSMEKSSATFDKEKAQERLSKLSGGVAVFKVGGASEAEVGERKDRVTDALNATRAAVEEGIVPGGGVALLYATKALKNLQTQNEDEKRGVQIIQNALKAPTSTIASNAGYDGALVHSKLLEQDDHNLGFDAAKGTYVDMVKAGIIDPLKVVRTALVDAASVSLLLTTTEAAVVDNPNDKNKPPSRGIRATWKFIEAAWRWNMGDGLSTKFWADAWIHPGLVLADCVSHPIDPLSLNWTLADVSDGKGGCLTQKFNDLLPEEVIHIILGHMSAMPNVGPDTSIWGGGP
ncbi:TCP-1-like chaperonin intermediate domain superfamily [Sesbania bispinosa]|nr:TCP-1-like chaperonin intermediate domain superfamily [Sesbania bispinosa]